MDGPRLDRRSERGRRFARELIGQAVSGARTTQPSQLGPARLDVSVRTEDNLAALIVGAFLPARAAAPDPRWPAFTLAVSRLGEISRLPSTEWAHEWTSTGRVVPAHVTYPYRVFLDRQVGIAYAFDPRSGESAVWIRRERELDLRSFITPFRVLLSWLADTFDAEVVHASAAQVDGGAVVMSGASGSGKSTLAIGLGLAGHPLISDDCVLLAGDSVHAVFARAKVDDAAVALLDADHLPLRSLQRTPRAKRFVSVDALGERFVRTAAVRAWAFPVLGHEPGHYRMPARRAYQMVARDSMREVFGGGPRNRLRLARSIRRHPSYRLLLGAAMPQNIATVRAALDDVTSAGVAADELAHGKVV